MGRRHELLWIVALALVFAVAGVLGRLLPPPAAPPRPGDEQAAAVATYVAAAAPHPVAPSTETDPAEAVERWLLEPGDGLRYPRAAWTVGTRDGADIPVVFYYRREDASLILRTGSYWGVSCQIFTVTPGHVTPKPVECPTTTLERPEGPRSAHG